MSVVLYINHQGSVRPKALYRQAVNLLLWALHQSNAHPRSPQQRSGHAVEEKDFSRIVHPESVWMIWARYGRAEVDLFTMSENAHCPLFFSLSHSPLEGDALTLHWPAARFHTFPLIKILQLVLCKIRGKELR